MQQVSPFLNSHTVVIHSVNTKKREKSIFTIVQKDQTFSNAQVTYTNVNAHTTQ
jgi:hypothetical protein